MAERLTFDGPAGSLEARRHGPADGYPIVLLHPHPQGGGTMGSRLVYDLAVGLAEAGYRTYRFNYRGVGASEGAYDGGRGETDDAVAVFDAVKAETGLAPVVIGHSFGGRVAVHLGTVREPALIVLVGTPQRVSGSDFVPFEVASGVRSPVHTIVGDQDEFVAVEQARAMAEAFPAHRGMVVLKGAGHFLEPGDNGRVLDTVKVMVGRVLESA